MLNGKNILITGGTGAFGNKFVETILRDYPGVNKIIIYSRGETAQYAMRELYPAKQYPQLRFFIGDVRDKERLVRACHGVDILIHAAGFSQASIAEYNPDECVKTYISGAQNIIDAALQSNISSVITLSSDKACAPLNLYGACQLLSDKLFVAANNMRGDRDIKFSVIRYGNVLGARGSVIPYFIKRKIMGANSLPITDSRMTRFNITMQSCIDMVLYAIDNHIGGEIFVPKCPAYCIKDVVLAIAPGLDVVETGIRPGEKLHESLITIDDAPNTIEVDNCYIILPSIIYTGKRNKQDYLLHYKATQVPDYFCYTSESNPNRETVESLRVKIRQYVSPNFK